MGAGASTTVDAQLFTGETADKGVSFEQLHAALSKLPAEVCHEWTEERLKTAFKQFDGNGDGLLSKAEYDSAVAALASGVDSNVPADFEAALLAALSAARTDPKSLAGKIRQRKQHFKGKDYYPPEHSGKVAVASKEGVAVVDEALRFLEKQPALSALTAPSDADAAEGLRLACEDHLVDRGTLGVVGHAGADGSSPAERYARYGQWAGAVGECLWFGRSEATAQQMVEDLVIDDGVANRGHRLCIFDERYAVAGAVVGPHKTFGSMAVIGFAALYAIKSDDPAALAARKAAGPPRVDPQTALSDAGASTRWAKLLGACRGCGESILGGSVMEVPGLGKYHKACFQCAHCSKPLVGIPYKKGGADGAAAAAADPSPFCMPCYNEKFAPVCSRCGKKIVEGGVKINGTPYHKPCKPAANAPAGAGAGAKPKARTGDIKVKKAMMDKSMAGARAGVGGMADLYGDL